MIKHTPGKIFLADERGLIETAQFRRYATLHFGNYAAAHKGPVGSLRALNEETLGGGQTVRFSADYAAQVLLIPITGAVQASGLAGAAPLRIEAGEAACLTLRSGQTLALRNPYDSELVSFLHVWLVVDAAESAAPAAAQRFAFDLASHENQLLEVVPASGAQCPFSLRLGRFAGRRETIYRPRRPESLLFVFILAGAFEVEGRLLHEKDGLALWNTAEIELEALSNNALVLVLEQPATARPVA